MELKNKKVTVVGLARSGFEAAMLLFGEGAIVSVTDISKSHGVMKSAQLLRKKLISVEIGGHTEKFLKNTELLVVSPGVEDSSQPIRFAERMNVPIISEIELGYNFCKGRIVAVTGTNGKSTVVSLIGAVLRRAGFPVNVCGNIGNPLSGETKKINKETICIVEVSSFQLERIKRFRPEIAVILNITPDHLDRYRSFEEYRDFKARIFENQLSEDKLILNDADRKTKELVNNKTIRSRVIYFKGMDSCYMENVMAASVVCEALGVERSIFEKAVHDFTPLRHRFEKIAEIGGIEFVDDSKATNIDSTQRALLSLTRPTVLIAGGKDKNLEYDDILPVLRRKVTKLVLIGETRPKMREIFGENLEVEERESLEEAVKAAYDSALPGSTVLLSPMCSSFDMFRDYKHRGEVFCEAVRNLKNEIH